MIIGKMASFPQREEQLKIAVNSIIQQVDKLIICLNEYREIPKWLKDIDRIKPLIPKRDLKDVGKFIDIEDECDFVFYLDDDILYPIDYVKQTIIYMQENNLSVAGYHGSIYNLPRFSFSPKKMKQWLMCKVNISNPEWYRKVYSFDKSTEGTFNVHQLGTGVLAVKGREQPRLSFFLGSQKFVDVRFASWAHKKKLNLVCLKHEKNWIKQQTIKNSIYSSFTIKVPIPVRREIFKYAKIMRLSKIDQSS